MKHIGHIENIDSRRWLNFLFATDSQEDCMAVLEATNKVCELCGKRWILHGVTANRRNGGGVGGSFLLRAYDPMFVGDNNSFREVIPYEAFDVADLIYRLDATLDPAFKEPEE